jgi:hypothetical protein
MREDINMIIVALVAATALLAYKMCIRKHSVEYHLYHYDKWLYRLHRGCYILLWVALVFNMRAYIIHFFARRV